MRTPHSKRKRKVVPNWYARTQAVDETAHHCGSCRSWSAARVNAFTLWKPQSVKVTECAGFVGRFMKTDSSERPVPQSRRPATAA